MINMQVDTASYNQLMKRLQVIERKFPEMAVKIVHAAGLEIETNAKRKLAKILPATNQKFDKKGKHIKSTFHSGLASSIHRQDFKNGVSVSAQKNYAAYVEFGTGGGVVIPPGWGEFAAKFKGKGIRKVNTKARPYLVEAFIEQQPKIMNRIRMVYKQL